jgi:hypothetical protein
VAWPGGIVYEPLNGLEPGRRKNGKQIDRQKDADGCHHGASEASDKKADEGDRDDYGT